MAVDSNKGLDARTLADSTQEIVIPASAPLLLEEPSCVSPSKLKQSYRRLVLLYDVGRQICSETDVGHVFDAIVDAITKTLNAERVFVAVVSERRLIPRASRGIDLPEDADAWPVSWTMVKRVLEQGMSFRTTDAIHDDRFGAASSIDIHKIRSVVCCPLGNRSKPDGIIYVDNRLSAGAFSRADLEFLIALSHYGALAIRNAKDRFQLSTKKDLAEARLDKLLDEMASDHNIVGASSKTVEVYTKAVKAARTNVPVLIEGETGTGKEVLARAIHANSKRASNPFITVNIGAFPRTLVESELFGHEKGAFTGADRRRMGRCELAEGGTLFLDEVQDIPLEVQPKLLRFLEQRTFERLGGTELIHGDVRIVCASNKDLSVCVAEGTFRNDLFYRLNSVTLRIPPLRERREDVMPLVDYFLQESGSDKIFDEDTLRCLADYPWPGNVRELRNTIEALNALVDSKLITVSDLPDRMRSSRLPNAALGSLKPLGEIIAEVEKEHISRALEMSGGNCEEAIKLLGISRSKFFERKKEFRL